MRIVTRPVSVFLVFLVEQVVSYECHCQFLLPSDRDGHTRFQSEEIIRGRRGVRKVGSWVKAGLPGHEAVAQMSDTTARYSRQRKGRRATSTSTPLKNADVCR